jgi:hypothetical protein
MEVLSRCARVRQFDRPDELEASTLAHAFLDLEESFRSFVEQQLPDLMRGDLTEAEVCDKLDDIGDELRHILYHVRDARFYRYLTEGSDA